MINNWAGSQTLTLWNQATGSNVYLTEFVYGPNRTAVGSITTNGTSASYNTSSDARLKDVTGIASKGLQEILALQVRKWSWKSSGEEDEGLVAQEVLPILPKAVTGSEEKQYMIDYSRFVPVLIKAMQEQQAMIEAMTTRIAALETKKTTKKTT